MKRRITTLLVLGILPWAELHAQGQTGQTATATFRVSATVNAVCAITASDLAFGTYSAQASSPLQATTLLQATCTPSTTYSIGLNAGTSPSATVLARKMVSGSNSLNYGLFSDSSYTTNWGNTSSEGAVTGTGTGLAVPHTVYGRVPASQNAAQGIYGDTITVTIYY